LLITFSSTLKRAAIFRYKKGSSEHRT